MSAIYRITAKHRWHLRFWSVIAVAIGIIAAVAPGRWHGDFGRVAVAIGGVTIALYLLFADYRMGRTVETTDHAIHFRSASGRATSVPWDHITKIVNHPAYGFLHITTVTGKTLTVDHQFENVQTLVREMVTKTGHYIEESSSPAGLP